MRFILNIDAKSISIIKSKFWRNGWIDSNERNLSVADESYLAAQSWNLGVIQKTHDELINEVIEISKIVKIESCASLLSNSLSSHRLQDRSFLSSAIQSKIIPSHTHTSDGPCSVCGLYREETIDQDVLLFEKIMWGGVRLTNMAYVWFDLKLLVNSNESHNETEELENLLSEIAKNSNFLSASKFAASLKNLKGNKAEREVLCGILGICDILQNPDHPGFLHRYPTLSERTLPNQHFIDLEWPFCWYNSCFGVNYSSINAVISNRANKSLKDAP